MKKSSRSVPQNKNGADVLATADGDSVLVPAAELAYHALIVARVR